MQTFRLVNNNVYELTILKDSVGLYALVHAYMYEYNSVTPYATFSTDHVNSEDALKLEINQLIQYLEKERRTLKFNTIKLGNL